MAINELTPTQDFIFALENGYRLMQCRAHKEALDLKEILQHCVRKGRTDQQLLRYLDRANALFKQHGYTCYIFDQPYSPEVREALPQMLAEVEHIVWHID